MEILLKRVEIWGERPLAARPAPGYNTGKKRAAGGRPGGRIRYGGQARRRPGARTWTALLVFGLIGQIAWVVENMYFNVFPLQHVTGDTG